MKFDNDYWHTMDEDKVGILPKYIAFTTHPAKDQLQETKAKIFQGASKIELGFTGRGKPSLARGETTPGLFGKEHREALKQIAKVNEVELTTHATLAVSGLAGVTREGHFSENAREDSVSEIKQAIEFNADVGGGAVVVHTGEFNRPTKVSKEFASFGEGLPQSLVDNRTGQAVIQYNKNTEIEVPIYEPDPKTGKLEMKQETLKFGDYDINTAKEKYKKWVNDQVDMERGRSEEYQRMAGRLNEVYNEYENGNKFKKLKILEDTGIIKNIMGKAKSDDEVFELGKKELEGQRNEYMHLVSGFHQAVLKNEAMAGNLATAEEYARKKTAQSLAEAGLYAMEQTRQKKVERPIFIAPENIFPEQYGGHPQELKRIVLDSREEMKKMLIQKGKSESEAKRLSEQHIKATFDIGHANTWKKYFKGDPNKSDEENDKEWKKWLINQTKDLLKHNVIGHVHITDNMGYADDHLPPGEGTVPFKEFTKALKEGGYKGTIVAEGGDWEHQNLLGAWRTLNSPIYRVDGTSKTWTDIEDSYLGRTHSPVYLVGQVAPSEEFRGMEGKPMWSGIPLE
ncbi:MAG: hypothetical protein ISS82_06295 [Nanoarchaeota archaeon]|nr:hypothetical protein [Nanoarchaeota archaeon]